MADANIIADLPLLRWRGLVAPPYDVVTGEWEHNLAPRRIPYVNGEVHDFTGRGAAPVTARLYFCNGLAWSQQGVERLFPDYWNTWKAQLVDGNPGELWHPVLGPLRARVKGAKFELRAQVRSGMIVDVSWVETVEDPANYLDIGDIAPALPTATLAANADAAVEPWEVTFAEGRPLTSLSVQYGITYEPGQTVTTISDVFDAIRPDIFAGTTRALALLASFAGDIAAMIDALEEINDVQTYAALDALTIFWVALDDMRRRIAHNARPTATYVPASRTTLDAVARSVGNTITQLMGLNFGLLRSPFVERGTPVIYYKAA